MAIVLTTIQKQGNTSTTIGSPVGLLLALTYAASLSTGMVITLISKN